MTVYEEVTSVMAEVLGMDSDRFKPETDLVADLKANSLDLIEIVTLLEEKYELSIIDDDLSDLNSVSDIVDYIERNVKVQT